MIQGGTRRHNQEQWKEIKGGKNQAEYQKQFSDSEMHQAVENKSPIGHSFAQDVQTGQSTNTCTTGTNFAMSGAQTRNQKSLEGVKTVLNLRKINK